MAKTTFPDPVLPADDCPVPPYASAKTPELRSDALVVPPPLVTIPLKKAPLPKKYALVIFDAERPLASTRIRCVPPVATAHWSDAGE